MHYWNQKNFEGLKYIGEKYSSISGYELFGEYCLCKEQGLKKQAVAAVMEFVTEVKQKSLTDQRKITEELSSLGFWNSDIHQLLPYPLVEYLKSTLVSWAADEEQNSTPHRWLGYIAGEVLSYERGLDIDPGDEI